MNNSFREKIRDMSNYTYIKELPKFTEAGEYRAKKMIEAIDKKYRKSTQKIMEGASDIIHVMVNNYNKRIIVQFGFLTKGCNMKKAGSCWNCNYGIKENCNILQEEYVIEFEDLLKKHKGNSMVLEALGSITDDKEFGREILIKIIDLAIEKGQFEYIDIETHITQIDEDLVKYIARKNLELPEEKRKLISFEIGVEDFNPNNRMLINKLGIDNKKIQEVYEMLRKYDIGLDINLIYGFPFQNENERINSMVENIRFANENLPDAGIVIFLMSLKDNTIMKHMKNNGFYELPNPWGFVEAIKEILEENENNYIGFSWFGEKETKNIGETKSYCCPECQNLIVNAVKRINGTFNNDERNEIMKDLSSKANELECNHYLQFQQQLEEERKNKTTKTPESRLHEYYEYVINNSTGAKVEYEEGPEL